MRMDISIFGPLRPSPTQAGILLRSWLEKRFREGRLNIMQNVEMCKLEKEMDEDGRVVFRPGLATRYG